MKTFNARTKQKYVDKMKAHAEADEIIKGTYWSGGKGCHVGCLVEKKSGEFAKDEATQFSSRPIPTSNRQEDKRGAG